MPLMSQSLSPNLSIGRRSPLKWPHLGIQVAGSPAKTIRDPQRSRVLPPPVLRHFPSNLGPELGYRKRRSGRSDRLSASDGREMAMNTGCAGGIHGCPGANWGTPNGCCVNSRHDISRGLNRGDWHLRTRLDDIFGWSFDPQLRSLPSLSQISSDSRFSLALTKIAKT